MNSPDLEPVLLPFLQYDFEFGHALKWLGSRARSFVIRVPYKCISLASRDDGSCTASKYCQMFGLSVSLMMGLEIGRRVPY